MYERGFIEISDVENVQGKKPLEREKNRIIIECLINELLLFIYLLSEWIIALLHVGYRFPENDAM